MHRENYFRFVTNLYLDPRMSCSYFFLARGQGHWDPPGENPIAAQTFTYNLTTGHKNEMPDWFKLSADDI